MKTLATLLLIALGISASAQQHMFSDEFDLSDLDTTRWVVVNPNADGQVLLTGTGELLLRASPLNNGSDLWDGSNYHAPRILQPVCGNWVVEAKYHANLTNDWQFATVLYSVDSAQAESTIDNTGYMRHGSPPGYCTGEGSYFLIDTILCRQQHDSLAWVRIEKQDTTITEHISFDGVNWQSRSRVELMDIRNVGPSCGRQPYDGQMGVYTNMFVEYFRFVDQDTLHISASPNSVIGYGTPVELSVDTVIQGAYAWFGPNDNMLSDSSTLVIGPADTTDVGWYHVIVSRLDCQFLTDSIWLDVVTSIGFEPDRSPPLTMQPNPAKDQLRVNWPYWALGSTGALVVTGALGQVVYSRSAITGSNVELGIAHLKPGAYFVTLQGDQRQAHGRFIKE